MPSYYHRHGKHSYQITVNHGAEKIYFVAATGFKKVEIHNKTEIVKKIRSQTNSTRFLFVYYCQ
jgi:hypothetical protein